MFPYREVKEQSYHLLQYSTPTNSLTMICLESHVFNNRYILAAKKVGNAKIGRSCTAVLTHNDL